MSTGNKMVRQKRPEKSRDEGRNRRLVRDQRTHAQGPEGQSADRNCGSRGT